MGADSDPHGRSGEKRPAVSAQKADRPAAAQSDRVARQPHTDQEPERHGRQRHRRQGVELRRGRRPPPVLGRLPVHQREHAGLRAGVHRRDCAADRHPRDAPHRRRVHADRAGHPGLPRLRGHDRRARLARRSAHQRRREVRVRAAPVARLQRDPVPHHRAAEGRQPARRGTLCVDDARRPIVGARVGALLHHGPSGRNGGRPCALGAASRRAHSTSRRCRSACAPTAPTSGLQRRNERAGEAAPAGRLDQRRAASFRGGRGTLRARGETGENHEYDNSRGRGSRARSFSPDDRTLVVDACRRRVFRRQERAALSDDRRGSVRTLLLAARRLSRASPARGPGRHRARPAAVLAAYPQRLPEGASSHWAHLPVGDRHWLVGGHGARADHGGYADLRGRVVCAGLRLARDVGDGVHRDQETQLRSAQGMDDPQLRRDVRVRRVSSRRGRAWLISRSATDQATARRWRGLAGSCRCC